MEQNETNAAALDRMTSGRQLMKTGRIRAITLRADVEMVGTGGRLSRIEGDIIATTNPPGYVLMETRNTVPGRPETLGPEAWFPASTVTSVHFWRASTNRPPTPAVNMEGLHLGAALDVSA